ncbi:MAG TPA: endonuclease/exonuclease/phosphatase family protein, partial [Beijerinckiaceae bacterium]|nr:endonuclease/exonuclease/phosphatase family protein [Beijerinckiaceae bacterium]
VLRILDHIERRHPQMPTVIMGDTNEWRVNGPCLQEFDDRFAIADCGPSFHSRRPVAQLDRIIVDRRFAIAGSGVHASAAAKTASDHLPVWARLTL